MTRITIEIPENIPDAQFLVDCACAHAQESIRDTDLLPRGGLVSENMPTFVIRKGFRRIGAVSAIKGTSREEGKAFTEVDSWYLLPRWRNKGYVRAFLEALQAATPDALLLRGPTQPEGMEAAKAMGIPYCTDGHTEGMKAITEMMLDAVPCEAARQGENPCFGCVRNTLHQHFSRQASKMILKAYIHQGVNP